MRSAYFEVKAKLGTKIRITLAYWNLIITLKHANMKGKEELVKDTLEEPDEIRRSVVDRTVFLYYKKNGRYFVVVVCKHLNGEGYIITTYLSDNIKVGEQIWKRQK